MNRQAVREGRGSSLSQAPSIVHDVVRSEGRQLEPQTRAQMESHFAHDFSGVRVHADDRAARSAEAMNARAYTFGNHIAFGRGARDRDLLEHELTHVVQQARGGERSVQCASVCDTYDFAATKPMIDARLTKYKADTKNVAATKDLILWVKVVRKCGTPEHQAEIEPKVPADIWTAAGSPLGGYTGLYPGYAASEMSGRLEQLGATETLSATPYKTAFKDPSVAAADVVGTQKSRSKRTAKAMVDELERTDVIYFMGHHYGRYRAPGAFALAVKPDTPEKAARNESRGFDLRYIEKKGGFPNVKVMISTACATLCREAFNIFHGLFPKAALLGYRSGAPLDGGAVRDSFDTKLKGAGPLLLSEAADIGSIISAWKSAVEEVHKKKAAPEPSYYDGSKMETWNGTAWEPVVPTDKKNVCPSDSTHDYRQLLPGPAERRSNVPTPTPAPLTCGEAGGGECR